MKCLTVRQPYASQIVRGEKVVEWRSRPTRFRGVVAIHAARGGTEGLHLPRGVVIGSVRVAGCRLVADPPYPQWPWAWDLADAAEFPTPVPATGRLGLWEWTPAAPEPALSGRLFW